MLYVRAYIDTISEMHRRLAIFIRQTDSKAIYILLNERKIITMVSFLQGIVEAFRFPTVPHFTDIDNVDPNLVRYFRTEYGRNWQDALNEHLYNSNKNKYLRQD